MEGLVSAFTLLLIVPVGLLLTCCGLVVALRPELGAELGKLAKYKTSESDYTWMLSSRPRGVCMFVGGLTCLAPVVRIAVGLSA